MSITQLFIFFNNIFSCNLIINQFFAFDAYRSKLGNLVILKFSDFFNPTYFIQEMLFFLNIGFFGFLICFFLSDKNINTYFIKFILTSIFIIQYFYFFSLISLMYSLKAYPFGVKLRFNGLTPFLGDFVYGFYFNPINYSFVLISITLTFVSFLIVCFEKKNISLKKLTLKKSLQNIFLINLFFKFFYFSYLKIKKFIKFINILYT